jgi:hypothetical protein
MENRFSTIQGNPDPRAVPLGDIRTQSEKKGNDIVPRDIGPGGFFEDRGQGPSLLIVHNEIVSYVSITRNRPLAQLTQHQLGWAGMVRSKYDRTQQ